MKIYYQKNYITADLHYPERNRTYEEIIEYVSTFQFKEDTVVATLSDVVVRELNILVMRGIIDYQKLEVYSAFDEEPVKVYKNGFLIPSIDKAIQYQNTVANATATFFHKENKVFVGCEEFKPIRMVIELMVKGYHKNSIEYGYYSDECVNNWLKEHAPLYEKIIKTFNTETYEE
jgi:hypothetical protein